MGSSHLGSSSVRKISKKIDYTDSFTYNLLFRKFMLFSEICVMQKVVVEVVYLDLPSPKAVW